MTHVHFFRNVIWQYGLQILKYLFPLLLVPYLTRMLGTECYAVYAYVISFMGIIQTIADFGFTLSGTKKIVDCKTNKDAVSRLVGNITIARLMLAFVLAIIVLIIAHFIPILSDNIVYVFLAFIAVVLRSLLPDFVFQGYEKMGPLTTRYFISKGLTILLTVFLVRCPSDLLLDAVADIAGAAIGLMWSFVAMWRLFEVGVKQPTFRHGIHELRDSAIYCISNVSSALFSGFTTIIIGLAITDKAEIAFWSITLTTVSAVQSLFNPIVNSLYPHMLNNKDFRFSKILAIIALPFLLLGTFAYCYFADYIMIVLGGYAFIDGAHTMRLISPILIISFYGMLIGWPILGAMGYVKELTASTVLAGIVNIIVLTTLLTFDLIRLDVICVVRWGTDALLLLSRVWILVKVIHGMPCKCGSRGINKGRRL